MNDKPQGTNEARDRWAVILIALLLAVAVRTWIAAHTYLVSTDSERFIWMAEHMKQGDFTTALNEDFHPLYPAMFAGLSHLTGFGLETSGVIIAIALGSLTALPLYFIARELFGPLAGALAGLALAFHPYSAKQSADIMTEAPYIFFFLCGVWALLWGMRRGDLVFVTACGMFAGLAYLVRPEGMGLLLPAFIYLIICRKTRLRTGGRAAGIVMAGLACVIVASPYIVYLNKNTKDFDIVLTKKKSLLQLIGMKKQKSEDAAQAAIAEPEDALEKVLYQQHRTANPKLQQAGAAAWEFVKTLGPLGLAALIGVVVLLARRNAAWGNAWLAWLAVFYALVVAFLAMNVYSGQAPSQRHVLPIVTICVVWAGFGMERFIAWASAALNRRTSSAWMTAMPVIFLALVFAGLWATMLGPRRQEQLGLRCAAEIIVSQGVPSPKIMCAEEKVPYYAHGSLLSMPPFSNAQVTGEALAQYARSKKVNFVVISEADAKNSFKFFDPDIGYDKERFELLTERADEACVKRMYGISLTLKDKQRYLIYRVKY